MVKELLQARTVLVCLASSVKMWMPSGIKLCIYSKGEVSPSLQSLRLFRFPLCGALPRDCVKTLSFKSLRGRDY
ncbi:MAG: hypothetical protein LBD79_11305, partial [Treponema sp.]|nr:hypothetical protein [Treponema sp.]